MKITRQIPKFLLLVVSFFLISNAFSQTCPTGLVSYWKMDEISGTTLVDAKGGHNATCNTTLGKDYSGIVRYAQVFDLSKNASVANNADFSFGAGSSFTIIYWMKFTETDYGGQDHVIVSKGDYGGGNPSTGFFSSGVNGAGKVNFLLSDGSSFPQLESDGAYNDGTWHQVACVLDNSADYVYLYVDGAVIKSQFVSFGGSFSNSNSLLIGSLLNNSSLGFYYRGSIDEIAIYNRALSASEILNQKNAAKSNGIGICDGEYPEITSIPVTKAVVGKAYSYTVHAMGKQTGMTYSLVTNPSGMTISSSTGAISWTPASKNIDGLVKVRANNNVAPADTQTFRVFVSDAVTIPAGLICLHKLDETTGPTYADYLGSHNADGLVSPTATTGKINGAQAFGSSTKIDIPDNADEFDWSSTGSFTISLWIKTSSAGTQVCVARNRTDVATYEDKIARWFIGTSGGVATFELQDNNPNNNAIATGTASISDNNWHHLVAVRDGSGNKNKIYVDGALDAEVSKVYGNSFVSDVPTPVTVGYIQRLVGFDEYNFVGSMDEVAIYNKALSASDVAAIYNGGNPAGICPEGNYAPQFSSTPATSVNESTAYTYNVTTEDPDGATVTITAPTKPSWLSLNYTAGQKTATLTGTPTSANVGANSVKLKVVDAKGDSAVQSFSINVINVNDSPVVTSSHITTATEGSVYTYNLTVTDADLADVISIATVTLPSWLTFNYTPGAKTATISGTPDDANVGANPVNLSITDQHVTINDQFTITVAAVNDLPQITAQSNLNTSEDVAITLSKSDFTIVDPDNSASDLTLSVQSGTNYTFSGNTVTPSLNFSGALTVNVVVNDLNGSSTPYQATVNVIAVNDAPTITSTAPTTVLVGSLYVYLFKAQDVDNPTITLSAIAKPSWLTYNSSTNILSGTPSAGDVGEHLVILRASDGVFNIDQAFTITVSTTGITEVKDNEFELYPVPASEVLNIKFKNLEEESVLNIYNISGSLVQTMAIPAGTETFMVPVQEMKAGLYIIHIKNNTLNSSARFYVK